MAAQLAEGGIRVSADLGSDRMGAKIRQAQGMKIPYMLIVGDQEAAAETLGVRYRDGEQRNELPVAEFAAHVSKRIRTRSAEL